MTELPARSSVIIVEDDAAIAEALALNLKLQGYRTQVVGDGETARTTIESERPDLVLLDITLPRRSGLWVLEQLRLSGDTVPIIVLSARQDEFDKVAALNLGADDYVTKPFALAELLARVSAVLRRAQPRPSREMTTVEPPEPTDRTYKFNEVVVDLGTRTVTRAGQPLKLTHLEFELLSFFCRHASRVFSRHELLREVWGMRTGCTPRTVDNFVAQLRAKIESDPDRPRHLVTVRGSGYRFDPG